MFLDPLFKHAREQPEHLAITDIAALPSPPADMPMPRLPTPAASDLAVLMYTSGTSGLPKGVELTYGNLDSDVRSAIEHASLQGKHKFLGILPLFHSTGLCPTCGYDLRATPDRCPECGAVPKHNA